MMVFDCQYIVPIDFSVFHVARKIKGWHWNTLNGLYTWACYMLFSSIFHTDSPYHSLTLLKFMSSKFPQVRTFGSCDIVTDYVSFLPLNLNITKRVEIKNIKNYNESIYKKTSKCVLINIFKNFRSAKKTMYRNGHWHYYNSICLVLFLAR